MSKRRKRKSQNQPNLPEATLARARHEAGLIEDDAEDEAPEVAPVAKPTPRQETLPPVQKRRRRREVDPEELTHEEIIERLAHPTRVVTEEQLRQQYTYVMTDLRGMGMLAGLLFIVMIIVARFL